MSWERGLTWVLGPLAVAALVGLALVVILAPALPTGPGPVPTLPGSLASALAGTVALTLVGLALAAPLGVATGICLTEYRFTGRSLLRGLVVSMEGVPSIAVALAGSVLLFGGGGVWVAGLTLGAVVLPGIIRATGEALEGVPQVQRDAALALGQDRYGTIVRVVLPACWRVVLAGVIRASLRCIGATAPLLLLGVGFASQGAEFETLTWWVFHGAGHGAGPGVRAVAASLLVAVFALRLMGVYMRRSR